MSVQLDELVSSPVETFTPAGCSMRRHFVVSWKDRHQFVNEIFHCHGPEKPARVYRYAGARACVATKVEIEPWDGDNLCAIDGVGTLLDKVIDYPAETRAKVTVWYEEEES